METLMTAEQSKSNSNVTANKVKQQSFFSPAKVQPKLTIGAVDDPYEREADAVAEKVMRMPAQKGSTSNLGGNKTSFFSPSPISTLNLQHKCAGCEEEEKKVQMKGESGTRGGMTAPPIVNDAINSGGQPMDAGTKDFMESRFGNDFSNVQIHNDSLAHKSSADINALAYTHGNHVVFGEGRYQPGTDSGKTLLAHELTHTLQQKGGKSSHLLQQKGTEYLQRLPSTPALDVTTTIKGSADTYDLGNKVETVVTHLDGVLLKKVEIAIDLYWDRYDTAVEIFAGRLKLSQEIAPESIEARIFTAPVKFFRSVVWDALKDIEYMSTGFILGFGEELFKSRGGSDDRKDEVVMLEYIEALRKDLPETKAAMHSQLIQERGKLLRYYKQLSEDEPEKGEAINGVVHGMPAELLQNIKKTGEAFTTALPTTDIIWQLFTESYIREIATMREKEPGSEFGYSLIINFYVDTTSGENFTADENWYIKGDIPQRENAARSLEAALNVQNKDVFESNLPKIVYFYINNERYRGDTLRIIFFENNSQDFKIAGTESSLTEKYWRRLAVQETVRQVKKIR